MNQVQSYINQLNRINVPENELNILDFLSSLDGETLSGYLSFILSQSHIFDPMDVILSTHNHNDFYTNAGYSDRTGNIVPKLGERGEVFYEEYVPASFTDKMSRDILASLQSGDKKDWAFFAEYIKSIYEPDKMDIYHNTNFNELYMEVSEAFHSLGYDILQNNNLQNDLDSLANQPVEQRSGLLEKIKGFFADRKLQRDIKKKESMIVDESEFSQRALGLIEKYKGHHDVSKLSRKQLEFAKSLIQAGLPQETLIKVLDGLSHSIESSSASNYSIFNMLKQLSTQATIGKQLYSPEILYADSFQEMTKKIRGLISHGDLSEGTKITTEYRLQPLRNALNAGEDIQNVLKGKNLSQPEIQARMSEFDEEFQTILQEQEPETYVRRCTDLMMKFVSTHPFDDGNGRTSRMLLQVMLARRGILLPSTIDNYYMRQSDTDYSKMEDTCLRTDDYTPMEDYIVDRAKKFNNGILTLDDQPLSFEHNERQKLQDQEVEK